MANINKFNLKETGITGIENQVKRFARCRGWYVRKFVSPGNRGAPDALFISPHGRVVFIEFKSPGKRPTHKQEIEINRLLSRFQEVYIVDNLKFSGTSLWRKDCPKNLKVWHDGFALIEHLEVKNDLQY